MATTNDTIRNLTEQYGPNSPSAAEQLNLIGDELTCRRDTRAALKCHQEALRILEFNKCNAILYDFMDKSKQYAIDMALTLRKIGNLLRDMNDFVGAAGKHVGTYNLPYVSCLPYTHIHLLQSIAI